VYYKEVTANLPTPYEPLTPQRPDPIQAVREYYLLVGSPDQLEIAWNKLSIHFKNKHNCCINGQYNYKEYLDWWGSVFHVEIHEISVEEQTPNTARVRANLTYFRYNAPPYPDPNYVIELVWDSKNQQWLWNDVCRNRYACTE
jgi:hypothetical protein